MLVSLRVWLRGRIGLLIIRNWRGGCLYRVKSGLGHRGLIVPFNQLQAIILSDIGAWDEDEGEKDKKVRNGSGREGDIHSSMEFQQFPPS
jgi:hypothetical protein